jgi:acetyltransferase-like isoleucine patch superfamily enzyme
VAGLTETIEFARYLGKTGRDVLRNERALWRLESRFDDLRIVRPFSIVSPERLQVGRNLLILRNCHFHCGGMAWSGRRGHITVGDDCWFSENNVLYGAGGITIGNNTGMGPGVMIFSSREDLSLECAKPEKERAHLLGPVVIGSHVLVFAGVIIGPDVTIGEGAVLGAGSVVLDDIPPWSVAAGAPAKVVRERGADAKVGSMLRVAPDMVE